MTRPLTPARQLLALAALLLGLTLSAPAPAQAAQCKKASVPAYKLKLKKATKLTLCLTNKARKKRGMKKLRQHKQARKAAVIHTQHMLEKDCFAHVCANLDLGDRFSKVGYNDCNCYWQVGENIATGAGRFSSPRRIHKSWMRSPGHRANILNPAFRHIGISIKRGSPSLGDQRSATYTTTFGVRR